MKNLKLFGFIAAVVLFLGIGVVVIVRQESKGSAATKADGMAANREKPSVNADMPSLDAPRGPVAPSAKQEVVAPSVATLKAETDFASLLAPEPSTPSTADDLTEPKPLAKPTEPKQPVSARSVAPSGAPAAVQQPKVDGSPKVAVQSPAKPAGAPVEDSASPGDVELLKASIRRLEQQVVQLTAKGEAAAAREAVAATKNLQNARNLEATQARELASRANHNVDAMRALIDTLILKTGTLEMAQAEMRKTAGKDAFLNQGNQALVGRTREYASAIEKGEIMANLPGLSPTVQVTAQVLDFSAVHQAVAKSNSIDGFTKALTQLAEAGYDAHLVIGEPNPRTRPIWLEIYNEKGLSVLHPELNGSAFQHMDSRKGLPVVFSTGAFGVTYSKGKADAYRLAR